MDKKWQKLLLKKNLHVWRVEFFIYSGPGNICNEVFMGQDGTLSKETILGE